MRAAFGSILLVGLLTASAALATDSYYFRAKPMNIGRAGEAVSVTLVPTAKLALTTGVEIAIPASVTGATGTTCRAAYAAAMPGLEVDPSTCNVSGAPTAAVDTPYRIAVEVVRGATVVAGSNTVNAVLRAPLKVDVVPEDIMVVADGTMPTAGLAAAATGGHQQALRWSLDNAPEWIEVVAGANGTAALRLKPGFVIVEMPKRTVTIVAEDDEGRRDARTFAVTAIPGLTKLLASDGAGGDHFGASVSVSSDGSTAIIGAPQRGDKGANSGAAYVFTRSGAAWTQQAKLLSSDGVAGDYFGNSVSVSSDGATALIGSFHRGDSGGWSGAVYVFTRSGTEWMQQAKLLASDGMANDMFGNSVSVSADGSTAVVGAHQRADKGNKSGAVYIFTRSGTAWSQQAKLLEPDGRASNFFGGSVSVSGDGSVTAIGARGRNDRGADSGAAYIFTRSGSAWVQQAKLLASDGAAGDRFGLAVSVSFDGSTAIIGADLRGDNGLKSGAAYVFTGSGTTWSQQVKLLAPDGRTDDQFGYSVSVSSDGSTALMGAIGRSEKGSQSGAAYLFTRYGSAWSQEAKLLASDGKVNDMFGYSVSVSSDGTTAFMGAYGHADMGTNSGAAYAMTPR